MNLEPEFKVVAVFDSHILFSPEVVLVRGIDDREFTCFERRVLHIDTHQKKVRKLNDMHRANAALTQEVGPVFLGVFVVDTVLEVVRQQVLNFNRRGEAYSLVWVYATVYVSYTNFASAQENGSPGQWVVLVEH